MSWKVTFTVVDGKNKNGSFSFHFDPARTVDQLIGWIGAISPALAIIMKGGINAISVSRSVAVPLLAPSVPSSDSDIEEKMRSLFDTAGGFSGKFSIPTLDEALVNEGSTSIDQSNAGVILLNTAVESGIDVGGTVVAPTDSRGDAISQIRAQNEVFLSSYGE